jgi:hypothetical protein
MSRVVPQQIGRPWWHLQFLKLLLRITIVLLQATGGDKMTDTKERSKHYVWVKDAAGNEFLCPADALKKPEEVTKAELKDCINVDALKPYIEM